jgi:hypothetical protein
LDIRIPSRRAIQVCDGYDISVQPWLEEFKKIAYTLHTRGDGFYDMFVDLGLKQDIIFGSVNDIDSMKKMPYL